jgi:cell division protein FtsL
MTRLHFLLLAILIGCALSVVTSQHQARKAFIALQSEKDREAKLDNEWRELQIESQTLGQARRIEQKASRELGMTLPDPKKTIIVVADGSSAPTQAAPVSSKAGATK